MTYNYPAFKAVLQAIEENPKEFDMGTWCGTTTKCVAGWTCFLFCREEVIKIGYEKFPFSLRARKILGMKSHESDLFLTNNNNGVIDILKALVSQENLPATEQRTIHQIAESLKIEFGPPF